MNKVESKNNNEVSSRAAHQNTKEPASKIVHKPRKSRVKTKEKKKSWLSFFQF